MRRLCELAGSSESHDSVLTLNAARSLSEADCLHETNSPTSRPKLNVAKDKGDKSSHLNGKNNERCMFGFSLLSRTVQILFHHRACTLLSQGGRMALRKIM